VQFEVKSGFNRRTMCELINLSSLLAAFLALAIEPKPFFIRHLFDLLQSSNCPLIVLGINITSGCTGMIY